MSERMRMKAGNIEVGSIEAGNIAASGSGRPEDHRSATLQARAGVVNRTHRVVREQAMQMQEKRARTRSLWVPIGIFSVLLSIILCAVWLLIDAYDLTPNGIPDASDQMMVLLLWSVPLTILLVGVVWLKRQRKQSEVR